MFFSVRKWIGIAKTKRGGGAREVSLDGTVVDESWTGLGQPGLTQMDAKKVGDCPQKTTKTRNLTADGRF